MCDGQWTTAAATDNLQDGAFVTFSSQTMQPLCMQNWLGIKLTKVTWRHPQPEKKHKIKHILSYLTTLHLIHCPNNSGRYCLTDITTLCQQSASNVLFFKNITKSCAAEYCWAKSRSKITKLWFHMLAHIWLRLTAEIRNSSWFSVALLQRRRTHSFVENTQFRSSQFRLLCSSIQAFLKQYIYNLTS